MTIFEVPFHSIIGRSLGKTKLGVLNPISATSGNFFSKTLEKYHLV